MRTEKEIRERALDADESLCQGRDRETALARLMQAGLSDGQIERERLEGECEQRSRGF